jgi:hypothetical protein
VSIIVTFFDAGRGIVIKELNKWRLEFSAAIVLLLFVSTAVKIFQLSRQQTLSNHTKFEAEKQR